MTYAWEEHPVDAVDRRIRQELPESHPFPVMLDDPRDYVARQPRHQAVGSAAPRLEVERCPLGAPEWFSAELLDFSRSGVRFRAAASVSPGESVGVRLVRDESEVLQVRPATVQWINADRDGTFSVGCHFDQPIEWETLGELFLSGILSTDRPSPKPEDLIPAAGHDDPACPTFNS